MKMNPNNRKDILSFLSLALILVVCFIGVNSLRTLPPTYDGTKADVNALLADPSAYSDDADGVAAPMVKENLEKTVSPNAVFSVVFNYRGYDTMGESFVLYTSVCGTAVILRKILKKKKEAGKEERA